MFTQVENCMVGGSLLQFVAEKCLRGWKINSIRNFNLVVVMHILYLHSYLHTVGMVAYTELQLPPRTAILQTHLWLRSEQI